jgi:hypothetical protein
VGLLLPVTIALSGQYVHDLPGRQISVWAIDRRLSLLWRELHFEFIEILRSGDLSGPAVLRPEDIGS